MCAETCLEGTFLLPKGDLKHQIFVHHDKEDTWQLCIRDIWGPHWVLLVGFGIWRLLSVKCGLWDGSLHRCLVWLQDMMFWLPWPLKRGWRRTQYQNINFAEHANTALTKHPIGRYRVWFGHSFHSQLCPLPLPVESLTSTLWCSPKNAQNSLSPSSSSSYPPRKAEREQGHGWKLPCPQMGSPRLCKSCSADIQSNPFLWVI